MKEENNINFNNKLLVTMQIINVFIGVIIALICVVAYITIQSIYIRTLIIIIVIGFGIWGFVNLYKKLHKEETVQDESNISKIELVNEENEIIRNWDIGERISFLIGKNGRSDEMLIDLSTSIYSKFIENEHAVLNYASGRWYVEDLSESAGVVIQKAADDTKYRIVKDAPCELKRGDILFISKVKLLLR
ncbi:MAG: FHA domain-containing protein [Clostridium beijerinckii]|nr:FHA domain-containing protein [Clostridium beijerinckii]MCI1577848.1 FHA domain-containing protein [Clostridium beijerinckii]MCI1583560.1 FHA domain-containing protein [Clostridium beijerinckii]MCI1620741.1 FHA domain-containing protein [Clostridium beijerinckii]